MLARSIAALLGITACALTAREACAQFYPGRTIEIIVPYAPGGSTDLIARTLGQHLQQQLGQSVIVVNRPGASGTVGVLSAARSKPDGYTLLLGLATELVIVPLASKTPRYTLGDFESIALTGQTTMALIGSPRFQARDFNGALEEIRQSPGKFNFGGGPGSPQHIGGEWLKQSLKLDINYIPYRGGAQAVNDVYGGHLDLFFAGIAASKSLIDAGSIRAFATTGSSRAAALPNLPTLHELGLRDFELSTWSMLLAPKGTPAEIVALLRKETLAALDDPKVREVLSGQGIEPQSNQGMDGFVAKERDKFGRLVRDLGITMEQ